MEPRHPITWKDKGACAGIADDTFFPVSRSLRAAEPALAICAVCPVVELCLSYALANGITEGVWGATTGNQRLDMPELQRVNPNKKEAWQVDHGTLPGARWHRRNESPLCQPCKRAEQQRMQDSMGPYSHGRQQETQGALA